ncbi:MAG: monovalent cation/H+ antiporter complex subunit F [Actinomycetota bacterium]
MITGIAIGLFFLSAACGMVRVLKGPHLADRVAALDVILISLMGGIVVRAVETGDTSFLNLLIVIAIVGFTATVAASQFIERGKGRT